MAKLALNILFGFLPLLLVNSGILEPSTFQGDGECRHILTEDTGSFTSPNYPDDYPDNATCTWEITVEDGARIRLTFTDFHLEASFQCSNDYLEIFNGEEYTVHCGRDTPPQIESVGNEMSITFLSDEVIHVGDRFAAEYETFGAPVVQCESSVNVDDLDAYGFFMSPSHPSPYPNGVSCRYDLLKDGTSSLRNEPTRIAFLRLKTNGQESQDGSSATGDVVGIIEDGELRFTHAGNYQEVSGPPPIESGLPFYNDIIAWNMSVSFESDARDNDDGFLFAFASRNFIVFSDMKQEEEAKKEIPNASMAGNRIPDIVTIDMASHVITATNTRLANVAHFGSSGRQDTEVDYGFFMSPNHPQDYDNNEHVIYNFTAPEGKRIAMFPLRFQTERSYDKLEIEDRNVPNDKVTLHGLDPMDYVYVSPASQILAIFTSDHNFKYPGFLFAFASVDVTEVQTSDSFRVSERLTF